MFFIGGESASETSSLASSPTPSSGVFVPFTSQPGKGGLSAKRAASSEGLIAATTGTGVTTTTTTAATPAAQSVRKATTPTASSVRTGFPRMTGFDSAPNPVHASREPPLARSVSLQNMVRPGMAMAEPSLGPAPSSTSRPPDAPLLTQPTSSTRPSNQTTISAAAAPTTVGANTRAHPLLKSRFPRAPDASTRPARIALAAAATSADVYFRREEVKPVVRPAKSLLSQQLRRTTSSSTNMTTNPSSSHGSPMGSPSASALGFHNLPNEGGGAANGTNGLLRSRNRTLANAFVAPAHVPAPLPAAAAPTTAQPLSAVRPPSGYQQGVPPQEPMLPETLRQNLQRERKPLISVVAKQLVPPGTKDEHLYDSTIFSFRSNVFGGW